MNDRREVELVIANYLCLSENILSRHASLVSHHQVRDFSSSWICSFGTGNSLMCSLSHLEKSLSISSLHLVSIWPGVYLPSRKRWCPNISLSRTISDVFTTLSNRCGGIKITPPSLPNTTSPGITVALPILVG